MTDEETIFAEAMGKGSAPERDAYLDQACAGNSELRRAVDALLLAHQRAGGILEASPPGLDLTAAPQLTSEGAGQTVGPYKLLEQIGGGGMGVVYMAEQLRPVRRKVALKIIKPGMDSRQVIARFEAERQALTMMDHPNIAKVLDAGTTDAGRPYFVMELVKGIPITDYCDQARLTTDERLNLFIQVCQAVQHAHQKGVIHRDLKPGNVLVTLHDDKPVPKVIDFGIAKAAGHALTDKTLFTNYAQMLGTPLYMSPEQAQISGLDVDTRSDVYSLGVLLYELLTGTTPFDKQRLRDAAYDEMRRIIREEDPPKPSTRLSTMGEQITLVSAHRHTDPKHLSQLVHGELDWIVMKTLEKDRARRYETPSGLAADVQRYLRDETVQACPPSAAYRFRKMVRRNQGAFLLASVVTVALLLTVVVLAVSNARITSEKNQKVVALKDREAALKDKGAALQAAQASEKDARFHEALARRRFYAAQMNLAMQAWDAGQPARTLQLLESQRPRFDQEDLRGFDWYYLWRLCQGAHRFSLPTRAYDNGAAMAMSPDGKTLASGFGLSVRLWDMTTGRQTAELPGHDFHPSRLAFSPDGKTLASCDEREYVRLWDPATGKLRSAVKPGHGVRGVQFAGDSRTLVLGGKSLKLWDVVANQEVATLGEAKNEGFLDVSIAADGNTVAACERDAFRVWTRDGGTWREGASLAGVGYYVPLTISPDGKLLAVGKYSLKLYDLPGLRERTALQGHTGTVYALGFSRDGTRLASGGLDRTVRLWDVTTGKQQACIANPGPVYGLALSSDATVVAAMCTDAIRVWDVAPPAPASVLHHAASIYAVAFSPDGKTLASYGKDGAKLWDWAEGREIVALDTAVAPNRWDFSLAFSPDGKSLATSGAAVGTIDVWDVTGRRLMVLKSNAEARRLAFSPDGKSLAEASGNGTVALWDLASQQRRFAMPVSKAASAVAFSPDGKTIAAGGQFGVVKLFDAESGRELTTLQRFVLAVDWVRAMAFSPDGHKLATGNQQGIVHIWDVATNHLDAALIGHTDAVQSLAFTDGGRTLATASFDRTIRLWDVAAGQERITLRGHEGEVTGVAFTPDGSVLATSSDDGTVRLWRAAMDADARARKREVEPDDAQSPAAHNERGDRLWQFGRAGEAEVAYRQALNRLEKLRAAFPDDPAYPQQVVRSLLSLSLLLRVEHDHDPEAEPARLRARAIFSTLSPDDQSATFWAYRERNRNLYDSGNLLQGDRTISQMIELIREDDVGALIQAADHMASRADTKLRDRPRAVELARQAVATATKNRKDRAAASACLGWALESNNQFEEAKEHYRQAIVWFTEDLAAMPERPDAWAGRAFTHFRLQQWEPAIADFTRAIELDPQVHNNWFNRGYAYIVLAQWDKAAADFTTVIERWPDDIWGWYSRAQIYAYTHRSAEAIADLRQAIARGFNDPLRMKTEVKFESIRANDEFKKLLAELESRFRPALDTIQGAQYLSNTGDVDEAIKVCSEILSREPGNDAAWLERANCYLRKGAFAKAVEDYTQVIKLKPDHGSAWHERGYCYLMLAQHAKAIVDHSKSIELGDHDAGQRLSRGYSYRALGQLQKAEEDYSRAIELNPTGWDDWYARARLYFQEHKTEKASSDLASLMKLPMGPGAQNAVAWDLATDPDPAWRNPALAVELAEKAIAARPNDGNIWNTVGAARYRNGQWNEAIAAFEKSMQFRNGGDSHDWFFLAMCHWQLGDKEAARKWYDQAVSWMEKNDPNSAQLIRFRDEAKDLLAPATRPAVATQPSTPS